MPPAPDRALRLLGLAARARALTVGVPLTCEALRRGGPRAPVLVAEASDTSENTHERVAGRAAASGVPLVRLAATRAELAHAVGKRGSEVGAVGVTDPHLADAVSAALGAG